MLERYIIFLFGVSIPSICSSENGPRSYSRVANWTDIGQPSLCFEHHLCTPLGKAYDLPHVSGNEMCSLLASKSVKNLHFFGDSYMRHMYVAAALVMTNNYKDASLTEDDEHCKYGRQFSEEPSCRAIVRPTVDACNGSVTLFLHYKLPFTIPPSLDVVCAPGQLSFWSEGNHPVDFNYDIRLGVNDPVEYQKKYTTTNYGICPVLAANDASSKNCSMFWISTHARHNQKFVDEEDRKVQLFNEQMRMFFEAGRCGAGTGYIDVYNMTSTLIHQHHAEANFMSFDAAHWGMEVNLVKVQIIMNALKTFFAHDKSSGISSQQQSWSFDNDGSDDEALEAIWKDYERNGIAQVQQGMKFRYNGKNNNETFCQYKSGPRDAKQLPIILIVFYEEIRSFHLSMNLVLQKIINPLREKYIIKLALFFRRAVENDVMNDMHPVMEVLHSLHLAEYLQVVKFHTLHDERQVLHKLNAATRDNWFLTHRGPLFAQYAQRYLAGIEARKLLEDYLEDGDRVDYVFYLRTDVLITHLDLSPILRGTPSSLMVQQQQQQCQRAMVWVPHDEDWGGLNDRFALFTACGFHLYASKFLDVAIRDLLNKSPVQGELTHLHVLTAAPLVEIRRISICYGVFRRNTCLWAQSNATIMYGQKDCERAGVLPPSTYSGIVPPPSINYTDNPQCESDTRLRDGDLVRQSNQRNVFLIELGTKRAINDQAVFFKHGWSFENVKVVNMDLGKIPDGPVVL